MVEEQFISNPYKKDEKKSHGEIVVSQIDVCRKEFSKELKKGFEQQIVVSGKVITVNVPDQRNTNIQCTKTLYDLMMFFFDDDFKASLTTIKDKLDNAGKLYLEKYLSVEPLSKNKNIAQQTRMIQNSPTGERVFQALMNYQSELYREMFQELVLLFKRRNELSGKRTLSWND